MTTTIIIDRAVVAQALEALEFANVNHWWGSLTIEKAITNLRAALAQQAEPTMKVGGHYHWKHDRSPPLVYVGKKGSWHQFERVDARGAVWCEVLGTDLHMVKETEQQAEPVAGKVVAWGIFTLTDGEWELQHPVFVGDECGKKNAEFERASYSGPQPLEVRPLGVVTVKAQQAEPVEPQPTTGMDEIHRLRAERDALADRLREVRALLTDTTDAYRRRVVADAWASKQDQPLPEDQNPSF